MNSPFRGQGGSSSSVYQKKFDYFNSPGGPLIFYNYQYDQLNRLTGQDAYTGWFNRSNGYYDSLQTMGERLKERIAYDGNGNIQQYLRKSITGTTADMDSLHYYYNTGTNQLNHIRDNVPANGYVDPGNNIIDIDNQSVNNYAYDAIGNLIKDNAERITDIKWNVYGKIQQITKHDTIIKYTYDASGNRISQTIIPPSGIQGVTWYVRDEQGNILTTYTAEGNTVDQAALTLKQAGMMLYGSSRLGSLSIEEPYKDGPGPTQYYYNDRPLWYGRGYKQYELTNHLGNVLATISDRKFGVTSGGSSLISYYEPHIVTAQDYYPFGMLSRVALPNSGVPYKFGFNGKMNDNDVKGLGRLQDYGDRIYDPPSGRFLSVDPLTKSYVHLTPYQFASNTPIGAIDIDGEEAGIPMNGIGYSGTPLSNYFDNAKGRKVWLKALGTGVVVSGAILTDVYVTKGAATRYTLYTLGIWGASEFISTVNNNSNQHDPKIRAENEKKAKQQATDLLIGFGTGYTLGKGLKAGKLLFQEAKNIFRSPEFAPMITEMSQPLTDPLPTQSRELLSWEELRNRAIMTDESLSIATSTNGKEFRAVVQNVEAAYGNNFLGVLTDLTKQARAAGATSLEIQGIEITNPKFKKMFSGVNGKKLLGYDVQYSQGKSGYGEVTLKKELPKE
jgi:RHS repeat-associated protein